MGMTVLYHLRTRFELTIPRNRIRIHLTRKLTTLFYGNIEASSARARNDRFLISGAADPSLLWGNGPRQRDRGEPGFGPHSPSAAGDWRGGARSPPSGHSEPPGGGRPRRSAPRSLALLSTPRPTRRTLKRLHGALLSRRQPFPTRRTLKRLPVALFSDASHSRTAARGGAGTRGGGT